VTVEITRWSHMFAFAELTKWQDTDVEYMDTAHAVGKLMLLQRRPDADKCVVDVYTERNTEMPLATQT